VAKRALVNVNGTLRNVKRILVNVNGTLRNVKSGLVNINGTLRQFFSPSVTPSIEETVQLTKSSSVNANYHNSTHPVTLTGKKYHFANASVFSYRFYRSPDQATWTPMTSETITTNPSSGSSSTVTYQLQNADFTSTTMYFKFEYTATNTTYNTTATSTSNIVSVMYLDIPAPPSGFPNINQSTISVASTASSGTWIGSPTEYNWKWYFNDGLGLKILTYEGVKSIGNKAISGTTATLTSSNHGFKSGDFVAISGVDDLFNASLYIYDATTNQFSYTISKPTWGFTTNYSVDNYVTHLGSIYKAVVATPTPRAAYSAESSYSANTSYVNYNSQLYISIQSVPAVPFWNPGVNYSLGTIVAYGDLRWVSEVSPNQGQTPTTSSSYWDPINTNPTNSALWTLINIYPNNASYWQFQNFSTLSSGTAIGPNYYEGVQSYPVSYVINPFPSSDYKTETILKGLTTSLFLNVSNVAYSSSASSAVRTIYGFPSIALSVPTFSTATSASMAYTQADMSVYDIDVKRQASVTNAVVSGSNIIYTTSTGHTFASSSSVAISGFTPSAFNISGATILSSTSNTFTISNVNGATGSSAINGTATATITGYPKTNQANSSPISITGLISGSNYIAYVTPKNADSPRVSGTEQIKSFTTPSPPGSFSISSSEKAFPSGSFRTVTGIWSASSGATSYNYQIEGSNNQVNWSSTFGTGENPPPYTYGNTTTTSTSFSVNATKYRYYRISVRAVNVAGTTESGNNNFATTGTNPGDPTIVTTTPGSGSVSIAFTRTTTQGSNTVTPEAGNLAGIQHKVGNENWSSTYSGNSPLSINLSTGTYTVKLRTINDDGLTSDGNASTTFTISPSPTASGFSTSDVTVTPSAAQGISVTGSSSNVATINWTNGSPATSVRVVTSGAGSSLDHTDGAAPLDTSKTTSYTSSGTINVTVTNFNNDPKVRFSWNQSNAQSYQINRTISGSSANVTGNASGASAFHDFSGTSVTINSLTVYANANQTGLSTTYNVNATGTASVKENSANGSGSVTYTPPPVAPNNGSVTVSQSSGSGSISSARWNDVYSVTSATASGNPSPSVSSYQWQRFNINNEVWNSVSGQTGSTFTINSTHTGGKFRCLVTFSNGVLPNLQTPSNEILVALPTVTSVKSSYFSTAPFVIWYVFGYNMQGMTTKTIIQGVTQTGSTTSASTNSDAVTNGITRQTNAGGTGQTYALIIRPENNAGGGGAIGTTVTTNALTNNQTNRNNSPVTNTFSAGGSI